MSKTYSIKPTDINRVWYEIDAREASLGRIASITAKLLLGKGKPQFSSHIDCGDYVVITNADRLKITGKKLSQKLYYRHSGYPSGLHSRTLSDQLSYDSTQVIIKAVRGMLPNNKLLKQRLARLKVYSGSEHVHTAQQPTKIIITKENNT
jgi:large subunit ribosomal protein L13